MDQLLRIDAQLAQSQQVVAKYSAVSHGNVGGDKELDQFMVSFLWPVSLLLMKAVFWGEICYICPKLLWSMWSFLINWVSCVLFMKLV